MIARIRILTILFILAGGAVIARLFWWQIVESGAIIEEAKGQYYLESRIPSPRGQIFSSDGFPIAATLPGFLVWANPKEVEGEKERIAEKLAFLFEEDEISRIEERNRILEGLTRKDVVWVPLRQKVTAWEKAQIEAMELAGIGFERQDRRVYPEGSSSAHILGFLGKSESGDDQGYFGLEGYYDLTLSGKSGVLTREKDAVGNLILAGSSVEIPSQEGLSLVTTVDRRIQHFVSQKLEEGIEKYGAKSGTVVVLEPKTGAILALSTYPHYDQGFYSEFDRALYRNPVVSDSFEPGSIFKILVMATALDRGIVRPETTCDRCTERYKIDKYYIETWDGKYHPDSTMTDVIVNSDNVGMTFVADKLGIENMYDGLTKFGIGSLSGIDLQEEANPGLRPKEKWNIVDLVTAGFGQGIAVTPIQMVKAVSAIANAGEIYTPRVVAKIVGSSWEEEIKPKLEGRAIGGKAAEEITQMMLEAVKSGEAKWATPKGFKIAGKTGTAQIPLSGFYDQDKTIASFVGFAPVPNPRFVMLVTLREPGSSPWGSETAAPLWFSIAKDLFVYLKIQPENEP